MLIYARFVAIFLLGEQKPNGSDVLHWDFSRVNDTRTYAYFRERSHKIQTG